MTILVSTWKNGHNNIQTGSGYGIRIPILYFESIRNWKMIKFLNSDYKLIRSNEVLNVKCLEIRSKLIGKYLISVRKHKWRKGKPHKLKLTLLNKGKQIWVISEN